ncbi:hypothetical protein DFH09DRAFT_1073176 [Mycena vulgaris]|nr:hypothetical protein DFH09DRAFT_1073176 [Mycena vulgaris]
MAHPPPPPLLHHPPATVHDTHPDIRGWVRKERGRNRYREGRGDKDAQGEQESGWREEERGEGKGVNQARRSGGKRPRRRRKGTTAAEDGMRREEMTAGKAGRSWNVGENGEGARSGGGGKVAHTGNGSAGSEERARDGMRSRWRARWARARRGGYRWDAEQWKGEKDGVGKGLGRRGREAKEEREVEEARVGLDVEGMQGMPGTQQDGTGREEMRRNAGSLREVEGERDDGRQDGVGMRRTTGRQCEEQWGGRGMWRWGSVMGSGWVRRGAENGGRTRGGRGGKGWAERARDEKEGGRQWGSGSRRREGTGGRRAGGRECTDGEGMTEEKGRGRMRSRSRRPGRSVGRESGAQRGEGEGWAPRRGMKKTGKKVRRQRTWILHAYSRKMSRTACGFVELRGWYLYQRHRLPNLHFPPKHARVHEEQLESRHRHGGANHVGVEDILVLERPEVVEPRASRARSVERRRPRRHAARVPAGAGCSEFTTPPLWYCSSGRKSSGYTQRRKRSPPEGQQVKEEHVLPNISVGTGQGTRGGTAQNINSRYL